MQIQVIQTLPTVAKNDFKIRGDSTRKGNSTLISKGMKRFNNLFEKICSLDNLYLADLRARRGKSGKIGVRTHDRNQEKNIYELHKNLINKTFTTSPYSMFRIFDPKERDVYKLPYYPDRIIHHAIMNVLKPVLVPMFTADSYCCIEGRGIHAAARAVETALRDIRDTRYCLKLDIRKFYPSVDHKILKTQLRRKIKDKDLLWLLDDVIDSADGLPIGNYTSPYFANLYLTGFDHWLKETKSINNYFRYADDLVILSPSKDYLHALLADMRFYLSENLKLTIKGNYQVFPVDARGIDFLGYKFFHGYTLIRKNIKKRFVRMLKTRPNRASIVSYWGWLKHCNSKQLIKKFLPETI